MSPRKPVMHSIPNRTMRANDNSGRGPFGDREVRDKPNLVAADNLITFTDRSTVVKTRAWQAATWAVLQCAKFLVLADHCRDRRCRQIPT